MNLTHGVTAALEILVLSAQVRILVGQHESTFIHKQLHNKWINLGR